MYSVQQLLFQMRKDLAMIQYMYALISLLAKSQNAQKVTKELNTPNISIKCPSHLNNRRKVLC